MTCILMYVQNVIRFIQASKKCWILLAALTSFVVNMACHNDKKAYNSISKNALLGRFFILLLFSFLSLNIHAFDFPESCVSTHFDGKYQIDYVIDGDTIVLTDKRHVRLIGINTPELSHDETPSEPGAEIAKQRLRELVSANKIVLLQYDQERKDRHGRTLAHLFLQTGENIQAVLLADGLAIPLSIPPNLSFLDCYAQVSEQARNTRKGLWAMSRFQPKHVNSLSSSDSGFNFIQGKVMRISDSRSSIWINLKNNVALRIDREDLPYFDIEELFKLAGNTLEANGWLYKRNRQLRMRIRHPQDITRISDN